MKILSHRGYWLSPLERNASIAFERSFRYGFGTETDVRDCMGNLVISHDIPLGGEQRLEEFLRHAALYAADAQQSLTLALNIKADGIADLLAERLLPYSQLDCFVFDMSVPDMHSYFKAGIPVFARMSEVERTPSFLHLAKGVWLDGFESEWYDTEIIQDLIVMGKRVCIVSPELHGRPYMDSWVGLSDFAREERVMLCTDKPKDAHTFFQGIVA